MEHNYNVNVQAKKMVENYFFLIRNLPEEDKIKLIAKISNSLVHRKKGKKMEKSKEEILAATYGCFESDQSAEEIIENIYNSRHFREKKYRL